MNKIDIDKLFEIFDSHKIDLKDLFGGKSKKPEPSFHDWGNGTTADDLLAGLGASDLPYTDQSGISSIDQMLQNYEKGSGQSTERTDMLYQFLLQLLANNEQRGYDRSVLNEQRQYDSPTNQLARLMAAGIPRDAAIQIINGSGSGSGGSALVGSAASQVPGVSAPSGTTEIARQQMVLGGIAAIANALVNMCSQGMQMAQAYETYQFQKNQSYMSSQQVEDYNAVNQLNQQLQILSDSGALGDKKVEDFRSANDLTSYLKSIAPNQPDVAQLIQSDNFKRATGTIYGRDFLNQMMSSRRSSQDAGKIADLALRQASLTADLTAASVQQVSADFAKLREEAKYIDAQTQETLQNIAESQARVQFLDKQGKFVDIQTDQAKVNYEISSAGLPIMKQNRIKQLQFQAARWRAMFAPDVSDSGIEYLGRLSDDHNVKSQSYSALESAVQAWVDESAYNAYDLAYLKSMHLGALAGFADEYPGLFSLCSVLSDLGIFDMVKTVSKDAAEVGGMMLLMP